MSLSVALQVCAMKLLVSLLLHDVPNQVNCDVLVCVFVYLFVC